jgi:hypothetical protein
MNILTTLFDKKDVLKLIAESVSRTVSGYTKVATTSAPATLEGDFPKRDYFSTGVVRLEGAQLGMELVLGIPRDAFKTLCDGAFGSSVVAMDDENQDIAGEVLNIAFGSIDPQLRKQGTLTRASLPKSFVGPKSATLTKTLPKYAIRIPFSAAGKEFFLEILAPGSLRQDWAYTTPTRP